MLPNWLFKRLLKRIVNKMRGSKNSSGSILITDPSTIEAFTANPYNTFLVSFPRTGSHWLRMLTELYFERPSLVRVFYYPDRQDYLMLHTHDLELDVERSDVIYLYRNPVDTIFSQLYYHKEPMHDLERITYWADLYGQHLNKWLHRKQLTTHKTILTYEGMQKDLTIEFEKVTRHFGQSLDRKKLKKCVDQVTKEEVKRKTRHDPQVVQLQSVYEAERQQFHKKQGNIVWDVLVKKRTYLIDYFQPEHLMEK